MSELIQKIPKVVNKNNIYAILSLVSIVFIAILSYWLYKCYLINQVVDKFVKNYSIKNPSVLSNPIDLSEFKSNYKVKLRDTSIKTLKSVLAMSDEKIQEILNK